MFVVVLSAFLVRWLPHIVRRTKSYLVQFWPPHASAFRSIKAFSPSYVQSTENNCFPPLMLTVWSTASTVYLFSMHYFLLFSIHGSLQYKKRGRSDEWCPILRWVNDSLHTHSGSLTFLHLNITTVVVALRAKNCRRVKRFVRELSNCDGRSIEKFLVSESSRKARVISHKEDQKQKNFNFPYRNR